MPHPTQRTLTSPTQIVAMYDDLGLTVTEIAQETGESEAGIKSVLGQMSGKYRTENPRPDVDKEEYDMFLRAYKDLALDPDVDGATRARVLRDLLNEQKGRNDVVVAKGGGDQHVVINVINEQIKQMKEARNKPFELTCAQGDDTTVAT